MNKKLILTSLAMLSFSAPLFCQASDQDFLRSTGKIYVVVAVIAVIFLLIVAFLIYLERRISKLEKLADDGVKAN